jgi:hypothetical protein
MLKPGRIAAMAFVFSAACAVTLNAQDATKKQETKKETKQKIDGAKAARTQRWQPGDPIGSIAKVDAEKKTITIRQEDGMENTVTIDEDVTVTDFMRKPVSGFDEKYLRPGVTVGWKADRKGKIVHLYVDLEPGSRLRAGPKSEELKKLESKREKSTDKDKNKEDKKQ